MSRTLVFAAAVLLAVAVPAKAQDSPVSINIGGGFTIPYSDLKDAFGTGGNFEIGVNFRVSPVLKIQAQYGYTRLGSKDLAPNVATPTGVFSSSIPLSAHNTLHDGDFNLLIGQAQKDKAAVPYGIVGLGVYHQIVNVTTPSIGVGTVCDPWLLICYPTAVPVDQIIGERTNTAFGYNLGAGVSFRMTDTSKFYAEIRYVHTYGPSFTTPAGASVKANGNYFPFVFGFRFHSDN